MRNRAPLFGVLAALLLGIAFYFLAYQPRNEDLEAVRAETAELESQRSTLTNEIRRLREIESREVEFRAALARLEEYIPTGIAQSSLIHHLQLSADQSGVTVDTVTFGAPEPAEEAPPTGTPETVLGSIPVSVTVEGGYFQMVDFLRRVEVDVPRAVLIETLSVVEGEDKFPQLSTTWNGQLFAIIPDTAVAPETPADQDTEAGAEDGAEAGADDPDAGGETDGGEDIDPGSTADNNDDAGDVS